MKAGQTAEDLERPVDRIWWPISIAADLIGTTPPVIRFMESELSLPPAKRNHKGERTYSRKEFERLRVVYGLTRRFSYETVKDLLANKELDLEKCLLEVERWRLK